MLVVLRMEISTPVKKLPDYNIQCFGNIIISLNEAILERKCILNNHFPYWSSALFR